MIKNSPAAGAAAAAGALAAAVVAVAETAAGAVALALALAEAAAWFTEFIEACRIAAAAAAFTCGGVSTSPNLHVINTVVEKCGRVSQITVGLT